MILRRNRRYFYSGAASLALIACSLPANAQSSTWTESLVAAANRDYGGYLGELNDGAAFGSTTGAVDDVVASQSFTGMNSTGGTQTLTFSGETKTQSEFGHMHSYTTGTVSNIFYNASNAPYYNSNTNTYNDAGVPDAFSSLGFAGFNDTLQYGGSLQSGYQAKYFFHVDGTASGNVTGFGAAADLSVSIAGNSPEGFFAVGPGTYHEDWITQSYAVNGVTPQTINVQFSSQFGANAWEWPDGSNPYGTADFGNTLDLTGIEMLDQNGNAVPVSQWTVTSASGTQYTQLTPEPAPLPILAGGLGVFCLAARRRARR